MNIYEYINNLHENMQINSVQHRQMIEMIDELALKAFKNGYDCIECHDVEYAFSLFLKEQKGE